MPEYLPFDKTRNHKRSVIINLKNMDDKEKDFDPEAGSEDLALDAFGDDGAVGIDDLDGAEKEEEERA